ncbi:hypothetical protein GRJ2_001647300 [Grus japonensis]|uniref:C2H2-type domain-containing protein n=1 Tax=Grus japonensis TaxID=30415 RepID=A0ABC9X3Q3_GRUJA
MQFLASLFLGITVCRPGQHHAHSVTAEIYPEIFNTEVEEKAEKLGEDANSRSAEWVYPLALSSGNATLIVLLQSMLIDTKRCFACGTVFLYHDNNSHLRNIPGKEVLGLVERSWFYRNRGDPGSWRGCWDRLPAESPTQRLLPGVEEFQMGGTKMDICLK